MKKVWFNADIHYGHRAIFTFSPTRIKILGLDHKYTPEQMKDAYAKLKDKSISPDTKKTLNKFFKEVVFDMNEAILERWNDAVGFSDDVYILGDVSFAQREETYALLSRMNGKLHLIRGNHDRLTDESDRFEWVKDYWFGRIEGEFVALQHFPSWEHDRKQYGSFHMFGHIHGKPHPIPGKVLDVGMESIGKVVIEFQEVKAHMNNLPIIPHHDAEREAEIL